MKNSSGTIDAFRAVCYFLNTSEGEKKMEPLPNELLRQLPPIREMHNPADEGRRMIFAKLHTRRTRVSFYVAEGERRGADYMLWGLLITPQWKFPMRFQITLGLLQTENWLGQEPCERDESFQPAPWKVVERVIPNLRRPL